MDPLISQEKNSISTVEASDFSHTPPSNTWPQLAKLGLGALGVVYGDIGTSPIYSITQCFFSQDDFKEKGLVKLVLSENNIFGILSLVFWSLTLVIVVKYLTFIMRADNHGEGGILALLALIKPQKPKETNRKKRFVILVGLGLFGAALLYGDGVITPAISVLSAVEGLKYASKSIEGQTTLIVVITVIILVGLFTVQKRGTHRVGSLFGPVMLIWFATISVLGLWQIIHYPVILKALNPWYAVSFFAHNKLNGFLVLGSVVLCITGGEALYADMGHFGRKPIRFAWYAIVFPALLLNYFGQGALLLKWSPAEHLAGKHPFFGLVSPGLWTYLLVLISTLATVIASQALISGAYSLTQQAIQLGYLPRLSIIHTSEEAQGQIYVPQINSLLMIACIALVLGFKKSDNLAAAYGLAVTGTMSITSILFYMIARHRWQWSKLRAGGLVALFLLFDGAFLGANLAKIADGGWFPLIVAISIFSIMTTWRLGKKVIAQSESSASIPLDMLVQDLEHYPLPRVSGTAVFMTPPYQEVPAVLLHHIKHNKVLHEQVILLTILTERVPEVPPEKRIQLESQKAGFYKLIAHYGFMQTPNVAEILKLSYEHGLKISLNETSFYLGRETLRSTGRSHLPKWRKILFTFLTRNARPATEFFGIPPNRVVELGAQIEI